MNLRDSNRTGKSFEVDETVRRILVAWGKERDSEIGRMSLRRAAEKLNAEQRKQLIDRLAEIGLGILCVIEKEHD